MCSKIYVDLCGCGSVIDMYNKFYHQHQRVFVLEYELSNSKCEHQLFMTTANAKITFFNS